MMLVSFYADICMYESSDIKEYLGDFIKYLREILGLPAIMIVGKEVKNLEEIAKSYSTTRMVRSFQGFREKKEIYYYEEEMQIHTNGIMLCKKSLDILLNAIEQNNHAEIMKAVDGFYEEMRERGIAGEVMRLNINYLLFQLLHLGSAVRILKRVQRILTVQEMFLLKNFISGVIDYERND